MKSSKFKYHFCAKWGRHNSTNYQLKSFKNRSLSFLSGMVSTRSFAPLVNPRMSRMTSVVYCLLLRRVGTDTRFDLPEECRGHQSATPPSVFISGAAECELEMWRWSKTRHSGTEVVCGYTVFIFRLSSRLWSCVTNQRQREQGRAFLSVLSWASLAGHRSCASPHKRNLIMTWLRFTWNSRSVILAPTHDTRTLSIWYLPLNESSAACCFLISWLLPSSQPRNLPTTIQPSLVFIL